MAAGWKVSRLNTTDFVDTSPSELHKVSIRANELSKKDASAQAQAHMLYLARSKALKALLKSKSHADVWSTKHTDVYTVDKKPDGYHVQGWQYAANVKRHQPVAFFIGNLEQTVQYLLRRGCDRIS